MTVQTVSTPSGFGNRQTVLAGPEHGCEATVTLFFVQATPHVEPEVPVEPADQPALMAPPCEYDALHVEPAEAVEVPVVEAVDVAVPFMGSQYFVTQLVSEPHPLIHIWYGVWEVVVVPPPPVYPVDGVVVGVLPDVTGVLPE